VGLDTSSQKLKMKKKLTKKKLSEIKISVCVPAYNRADTIIELYNSFKKQKYSNKELVICDDSTTDEVKMAVMALADPQITYIKNKKNLGFSKNLLKSLQSASGEYLIVLGDDDIFVDQLTLKKYANVFNTHKDVYYIYANQVQFSEKFDVQYEIKMFESNKYYAANQSTFKKLWLTSIFIGGIGLRNDKAIITKAYAKENILHPQVELIGNILVGHAAYTLSDVLIGFRSRDTQFIFRALVDKKQRQKGKHQNTEIFEIFTRICKNHGLTWSADFIAKRLIKDAIILYPKEKMILGNQMLKDNYKTFCESSAYARNSLKLKLIFVLSLLMPSWIIYLFRRISFFVVRKKNNLLFGMYKSKIMLAISPNKAPA
jgi:glycosyltransferase involved in cell wall biosynthesis